jgi:hypothetical protein
MEEENTAMDSLTPKIYVVWLAAAFGVVACSSSSSMGPSVATTGDAQTPPQGAANVQAWLAKGAYKSWASEPAIHASRPPSPHGYDRVFSNALIAQNAASTAPWPSGAAAVKELYASAGDTAPIGYAVYLKTAADSAAGASWYYYEQVPPSTPTSMVPHDENGVVADGLGASGPAKDICVGCHAGAGMDAMHTPIAGGHDFVYTPAH